MSFDRERLFYSLTIGCGSVLLFVVQPVIAKAILPRFGGSAGVWVTCMLFFQVALLLGYLYAYLVTRYLARGAQTALHLAILVLSFLVLPLKPPVEWAASRAVHPIAAILGLLTVSVGLPYFLLSTNSPLLQSWYAGSDGAKFPYGLFAWSNFASLVALLSYPVAIEPFLAVETQLRWWSGAYLVWALLVAVLAIRHRAGRIVEEAVEWKGRPYLWIALAACASALWLAVANHLSQEVAAIPFLWVLPLSVYLLTFILCFEGHGWYRPTVFRWLLPAAWIVAVYFLRASAAGMHWQIPIFLAALFVCCMFCHGELARTKPEPRQGLAFFYVMVASGGALGAVFVGLFAPGVFSRFLELPIAVTACVLLGLVLLYGYPVKRLIRLAAIAAVAFFVATRFQPGGQDVVRTRNFYGALQVSDTGSGENAVRSLYNGRTLHGRQFLAPGRSRIPTAFFGPESGAGRVLVSVQAPDRRVGVIGLGVGTLAAYGRRGDRFRFYEINPAVAGLASRYFRFLAESAAATDVVVDDGRLAIEREPPGSLDVIVVDAFSDDSIPVHLLTREAFEAYFRHLRPGGVLALHVTNRYLNLPLVVEAAAGALHKECLLIRNGEDPMRQILPADWMIVSDNRELMRGLAPFAAPRAAVQPARLWTDSHSNLFQVLK